MPNENFRLLNDWQRGFPLESRPFARVAEASGISEAEAIAQLRRWIDEGKVGRVGPVLKPGALGVSTLAAMEVPADRLDEVAALVSTFDEVNHNYERENAVNLWFVITASDEAHLQRVMRAIESRTGISVLDHRLEEEFRIDLGFDLTGKVDA